jgi:hypothetical protein
MSELVLTGIDGANPLGFFAALGVLRVLDERARAAGTARPRLGWRDDGVWRPLVVGVNALAEVVGAVMEDLATWADEPALQIAYVKGDESGEGVAPDAPGAVQDLKPSVRHQRRLFEEAARRAAAGEGRMARMMAAFGTEVAVANNGRIKPSALHFTAGQQHFLKMVNSLRAGVTAEDLERALVGPWTYESELPSLSWTGTGARMWALRASDPSKEKRGSCPGAEWLSFVGMSFFVCAPRGARVNTTGVLGGWKDSALTWPLWGDAAPASVVASLLTTPNLQKMRAHERQARAIAVVFSAEIARADPGGAGSFSPARLV